LPLRRNGSSDWADTTVQLPAGGPWRDVLAGRALDAGEGEIAASKLLADFPVALLARAA